MSFRFWRRIKIAPGVTLNLRKWGGSLSFGPRGAKFTVGSRGRRATVGIPGTGLFIRHRLLAGRVARDVPPIPRGAQRLNDCPNCCFATVPEIGRRHSPGKKRSIGNPIAAIVSRTRMGVAVLLWIDFQRRSPGYGERKKVTQMPSDYWMK